MPTYNAKKNEVTSRWYLVNLEDKILGRAASEISRILRGKNKPQFTANTDTGDFVIVINASKVRLTGKKLEDKEYHWHTGYPGGIKSTTAGKLLQKKPDEVLRTAVKGMLPKNSLGRNALKKLKIYADSEHPHKAQQPEELKI